MGASNPVSSLAVTMSMPATAGAVHGLAMMAPRTPNMNAPSNEPERFCAPPCSFISQAGGCSS